MLVVSDFQKDIEGEAFRLNHKHASKVYQKSE